MVLLRGAPSVRKSPHTLTSLKRSAFPSRFLFFDSESTVLGWNDPAAVKVHVPRLVTAEYWEGPPSGDGYALRAQRDFEGGAEELCEEFWGWVSDLASRRQSGTQGSLACVAHNIGYDLQATGGAARLIGSGWTALPPYAKGPIFIWRFHRNRRTVVLLSSTNWYAAKLASVGEAYGVAKLDTDTQTRDFEELRRYCRRDTAIVREAVLGLIRFLREPDATGRPFGTWAETISSVAFKAYRLRFMRYPIELHCDPVAEALERASYHGGRTEAFYIGRDCPLPVYDVDANSLFPSVMLDRLFPRRLLQVREGDLGALRSTVETGGLVIADIVVSVDRPSLPFVSDKLLFPVGTFRTTLCSPELEVAFREGRVHEVGAWSVYEGAPLFTDYVAHVYAARLQAREEGREAVSILFKYLGNCLYGKFGQKRENWLCLGPAPPGSPLVATQEFVGAEGVTMTERIFGGQRWVADGPAAEAFNSFPAIASFVTSYARVVLLGAMRVAGDYDPHLGETDPRAGREFYYCDTDSLFLSQRGYDRLLAAGMIHAKALGRFKLERVGTERVRFDGAKFYEFDALRRRKGIPDGARERWADGSPVVDKEGRPAVVYDVWPKLLTHLREGNLSTFENRPIIKRATVDYSKGTVMESGWVQPLRFAGGLAVV